MVRNRFLIYYGPLTASGRVYRSTQQSLLLRTDQLAYYDVKHHSLLVLLRRSNGKTRPDPLESTRTPRIWSQLYVYYKYYTGSH